jgi:DNA-binding transcriptional regulator YiaG
MMEKEELNNLLKKAGLTKKELSIILDCSPQTINNWGSTQNIPYWVQSWLENYIQSKELEKLKSILGSN